MYLLYYLDDNWSRICYEMNATNSSGIIKICRHMHKHCRVYTLNGHPCLHTMKSKTDACIFEQRS